MEPADPGPIVSAGLTPVPDNETVCGLETASSVKVTVPARAPEAAGVKIRLTWQEAAGASVVPQLLVREFG